MIYIEENKYRVIEHNGSFILQKADPNTILTSSPPQIKWDYVGIVIKNTHEIDRLKSENARLREALEYISKTDTRSEDENLVIWLNDWRNYTKQLAREALEGVK